MPSATPGLLQESLNPAVLAGAQVFAERFASAQPFRHVRIDDFLAAPLVEALAASFPDFDARLALNEDGVVGRKAVNEKVTRLGPAWQALDTLVQDAGFLGLVSQITGIPDLIYDPQYFGGGTHENLHGQHLDAHVDFNFHPLTRQHRRLNLILYLTPEWRDEWGGSIQLHRDPYLPPDMDEVVTITPAFNRLVIFETNEHSWHGFPRIHLPADRQQVSRRSFALYYYTDTRPAEELGPEHSTIYVEQHLPSDWQAGRVLDEESLQLVQRLLASRDMHLRRLYGHIKRLYTELNQIKEQRGWQAPPGVAPEGYEVTPDVALDRRLWRAEAAALRLQARVNELEQSTSWRVTAPMRAVSRWLRRR